MDCPVTYGDRKVRPSYLTPGLDPGVTLEGTLTCPFWMKVEREGSSYYPLRKFSDDRGPPFTVQSGVSWYGVFVQPRLISLRGVPRIHEDPEDIDFDKLGPDSPTVTKETQQDEENL